MECDEAGLPLALDEETRKARKMARNRRAAAVSRERKKQRVEELSEQVERLQAENAWLKRQLARSRSGSETSETISDVEWWPISQQPAVFWTYAPLKKACTLPPFPTLITLLTSLWTLCLSKLCSWDSVRRASMPPMQNMSCTSPAEVRRRLGCADACLLRNRDTPMRRAARTRAWPPRPLGW